MTALHPVADGWLRSGYRRVLIILCCALLPVGPTAAQGQYHYEQIPNAGIKGNNDETLNKVTVEDCMQACNERDWCLSFDYRKRETKCYLSRADVSTGELKSDYPGNPFDHYVKRPGLDPSLAVSMPQSQGQPASQTRQPMPVVRPSTGPARAAPPNQWLDLTLPGARPAFSADRENVLGTGDQGAISVWLRADWDDDYCAEQQARLSNDVLLRMYVYDHGSAQQARFRVSVTCDRRSILLENDGRDEDYTYDQLSFVGDGLRDGEPHLLNLVTTESGTEIWLDNNFAGSLDVGYKEFRSAQLTVGARGGNRGFVFPGGIARMRIYNAPIKPERLIVLGRLNDEGHARQPEWSNVVAYMPLSPSGNSTIAFKSPSWDPAMIAAGRPWMLSGDENVTSIRFDRQSDTDLTFQSRDMKTLFWSDACQVPEAARRADLSCGTQVLVMATTAHEKNKQAIDYNLFMRESAQRFRQLGGNITLAAGARDTEMRVGNSLYTLPSSALSEEDFGSAWGGGGGLVNADYSSKGFDLRKLDPFDVGKTGVENFIFAMNVAEMNQHNSYAWRQEGGYSLPYGLFIDSTTIGCDGSRDFRSVRNEQQLAEVAGKNSSITLLGLTANQTFRQKSSRMYSKGESMLSSQARCTTYILVLDKARAALSRGFRAEVELAAEACSSGIDSRCNSAVARIVERFGTHYPNAIGYGGVAEMIAEFTNEETVLLKSIERSTGTSLEHTVSIGGSVNVGGALSPVSASASLSDTFSNGFSQLQTNANTSRETISKIEEKMKFESRGGRGGSTFESWISDDKSAIPIYADIRPIPELLAPPFFTDPRVMNSVQAALYRHLGAVLPIGGLNAREFNTSKLLEPRPKIKQVAAQPKPRGPTCKRRTQTVSGKTVFTDESNASVERGDTEIDSDDWTSVALDYSVEVTGRTIDLVVTWYSQERNSDKSAGDTRFKSVTRTRLFTVESHCPNSRILDTTGLVRSSRREEYYRGEVHGMRTFPSIGSLRDIQVRFDASGGNDDDVQKMTANIKPFSVVLSESR